MGRLTTYDEFGEVWIDYNQCVNGSRDVLNKLAHYEDLEEQGRLIELPCAVGDTVYEVVLLPMMFGDMKEEYAILETKFSFNNLKDFGEWVFLTREEAEAKLAGGNNEDNL